MMQERAISNLENRKLGYGKAPGSFLHVPTSRKRKAGAFSQLPRILLFEKFSGPENTYLPTAAPRLKKLERDWSWS
jgi:hypothetical protein